MSDWSKVTRPIPVPNEWTKPFWEAAKRGVVELQRCQSCGHFQHPPYATCTQCVSTDLRFEPVRGLGTIYAYTIMYHTGDKRFASAVPYASIIVELDDAPGALMAGNLLEAEYTEAKVGRRVEVVFEKLNDDITLPQFRLAPAKPAECRGSDSNWRNPCATIVRASRSRPSGAPSASTEAYDTKMNVVILWRPRSGPSRRTSRRRSRRRINFFTRSQHGGGL